ncbi:MAG: DNA-binding beta-propeller fold protein YncE [Planctomycetota bacterium]|jgi:DNA-binding beta-propeller fold protein YncE
MLALMIGLAGMLPAAQEAAQETAQEPPKGAAVAERILVAAESADEIYELRFDGRDLSIANVIEVGYQATEIEGPHGLTVAPDGRHWFVSMAHGKPYGRLYKYATGTNQLVGEAELGLFPATMQISRDTGFLYCVNFDLHGDMTPSSVSVVDVEGMVEIDQIVTGSMPHGSRLSVDGSRHFSCAMMSDELIEVDAVSMEVLRRMLLTDGTGRPTAGGGHGEAGEEADAGGADEAATTHVAVTKPTWVQPHPTRPVVYVALNGAHQVVEVDLKTWAILRRFPTGRAPYNLDVTADGKRLVITYKGAQSVGVIDLASGEELARIPTSRRIPHGVVLTPDSRFAFITCEDKGATPGAVDAIDLTTLKRVSSVDIGLQAGGIALFPRSAKPYLEE